MQIINPRGQKVTPWGGNFPNAILLLQEYFPITLSVSPPWPSKLNTPTSNLLEHVMRRNFQKMPMRSLQGIRVPLEALIPNPPFLYIHLNPKTNFNQ